MRYVLIGICTFALFSLVAWLLIKIDPSYGNSVKWDVIEENETQALKANEFEEK